MVLGQKAMVLLLQVAGRRIRKGMVGWEIPLAKLQSSIASQMRLPMVLLLQIAGRRIRKEMVGWEIPLAKLQSSVTWQMRLPTRATKQPKVALWQVLAAMVMKRIAARGGRYSYHGGSRSGTNDHSPKLLTPIMDLLIFQHTGLRMAQRNALQQLEVLCGVMQVPILVLEFQLCVASPH
uniref:SET104 n=1 Tax=Arundo donax TaxID=35708 RepID=A0A0A9CUG6_ARUDO